MKVGELDYRKLAKEVVLVKQLSVGLMTIMMILPWCWCYLMKIVAAFVINPIIYNDERIPYDL